MTTYSVAVIAGDGIGPEVMKEGLKILEAIEEIQNDISFKLTQFDWNCEYYLKNGRMMPEDGLEQLGKFDVILFGAIGHPSVPDHISVWELILPIRRTFKQYVNLRPIKLLKGLESPLRYKNHEDLDFVVVRENTEGEYSKIGGRLHEGTAEELAIQNNVFTRKGTERIIKFAYDLAGKSSSKKLTVATKSNAINYTMPFWDEIVKEVSAGYADVETRFYHIDALAAYFISKPETIDVVVASNLFGDILSDLGAAMVGGLGLAPSGNINPEGDYPSMFEPIHGSAPDIAGQGIANPIAQIWSISLMMEHLKQPKIAKLILDSIEEVLVEGLVKTPDLGGVNSTVDMGDAIRGRMHTNASLLNSCID